mmetsp:Transcript_11195/g.26686  ORF Transcript_11195/g.26686 Transcript_11195/m.26686 type:complete len:294 (+) Transcript_11195:170-1051(+)
MKNRLPQIQIRNSLHLQAHRLTSLRNPFEPFEAHARVVQPLRLREWQRLANCLQNTEQPTQAFGVADALVHAIAHRESVALTLLVEEHAGSLWRHLHALTGGLDGCGEAQDAGVSASGTGDEPHTVGLQRVDGEPAVIGQIRQRFFHLERPKGFYKFLLCQWTHNRGNKLKIIRQPLAPLLAIRSSAKLRSQNSLGLFHQSLGCNRKRTLLQGSCDIQLPETFTGLGRFCVHWLGAVLLFVPLQLLPCGALTSPGDAVDTVYQQAGPATYHSDYQVRRQQDHRCGKASSSLHQ